MDGCVDQYVFDAFLTGDIPLQWTRSGGWRNQYAFSDNYFSLCLEDLLRASSKDLSENSIRGLDKLRTYVLFFMCGAIFIHQMLEKVNYLNALHDIPRERSEIWLGTSCIDPAASDWDCAN